MWAPIRYLASVIGAVLLLYNLVLWVASDFNPHFISIDRCHDAGGCWDSTSKKCRTSEVNATELCHRSGSEFIFGPELRICSKDSDCMEVGISCNGCCAADAINADKLDVFNKEFQMTCAKHQGAVCSCIRDRAKPVCINTRCALVPLAVAVEN